MTWIKPQVNYGRPDAVMDLVAAKHVEGLHTAMPGIVDEYDAATRRAAVKPAIKIRLDTDELIDRPLIVNVPVVWPAGGGWMVHSPLASGDPVLLVFMMRGFADFLKDFRTCAPTPGHRCELTDAVAIPGFGPDPGNKPDYAANDGIVVQSTDGDVALAVTSNGVFARSEGGALQKLATEAFVRQHFNTHTHSTPQGPSGPPIRPAPIAGGRDVT